jgi:ketosteroid isomerase-like protein
MRLLLVCCAMVFLTVLGAGNARADGQEDANLARVHQMLDFYGAGDFDSFIGMFADNVELVQWGSEDIIPLHGQRHGKTEVAQWFAEVDAAFKADDFGLDEFYADGDTVVVLGHQAGTAVTTGMHFSEHFVTFFTFNPDGKVSRFRGMDDSGQEGRVLGLLAPTK